MRHGILASMLSVISAVSLFCAAQDADAAVLTVTNGADTYTAGTLRSALGNCANGDEIRFASGVKTVTLTSLLNVWSGKSVTITGPVTITQTSSLEGVICVNSQAACTMRNLTITGGRTQQYGGGVYNLATLRMENCTIQGNTAWVRGGGVMNRTIDYTARATLVDCTISGNTVTGTIYNGGDKGAGGGIHNESGEVTLTRCTVTGNSASSGIGGGIRTASLGTTNLSGSVIRQNTPDNISGAYVSDGTNTIGNAPNKSATAFAGYSGTEEPEPRSIVGDADVAAVQAALATPESALYAAIEQALAADLGKTIPGKSTSLAGMAASLYYANTFEDVAIASEDLVVEYTASWPESVRYYPLFSKADGTGYENPGRGVQFEIKAGQSLPDGVTPPDFYVPGEGLMTWRNIVTDGGSYDLNPTAGVVTFRVCSVRAAEAVGDKGSGGGCNAAGFAPLALLLVLPLVVLARCAGWEKRVRFLVGCGVAFGIAIVAGGLPADALTVRTVTKSEDSEATEGTLRYWVKKAAGGDIITFSGAGTTVNLTSSIAFDKSLALVGPATIAQTGTGWIFSVPKGKSVTLKKLTLSGGNGERYGGALNNLGKLSIQECVLSGNRAVSTGGALYNEGVVEMTDSTISGNSAWSGGGVTNGKGDMSATDTGTLVMKNCVVESNTATWMGGGVENTSILKMEGCAIRRNSSPHSGGGALFNGYSYVEMKNCTIADNTGEDGAGIWNSGQLDTLKACVFTGNVSSRKGGALYNDDAFLTVTACTITGNSAASGGGIYVYKSQYTTVYCKIKDKTVIKENTPDQIVGPYTADGNCTIGSAPNKSATAFAGYSGETEPEPRSIAGDDDVAEVKRELADSGSDLFASIAELFSEDLGRTPGTKAAASSGTAMAASLYYANTFEDVAIESQNLVVEYTASWPESVRYYALFSKADGSGYELPDRGIRFELKAGRSLPDGVTPPDFYVPGEGLMTWRNIVSDNGSYDLNPTAGVVTFRVCSVRAAEATGDKGSGGGCDAAVGTGFAPLALLLGLPLATLVRRKDR